MKTHDHKAALELYGKLPTNAEPEKPMSTAEESLRTEQRRQLVMTTLWQRMGEIFGNQWELNFGKPGGSSYATWTEALAGYSEAQIRNGLEQCRQWDNSFIPHLGQFAKLCLTKRSSGPNFTAERVDREVALKELTAQRPVDTEATRLQKLRIESLNRGVEPETREESYRKLRLDLRWGAL